MSQIYNFDTANYNGVLIYLYRIVDGVTVQKQLTSGVDYIISTTLPSVEIIMPLISGDQVIINNLTPEQISKLKELAKENGLLVESQ